MEIKERLIMLKKNLDIIKEMDEPYLRLWEKICEQYADALNRGSVRKVVGFTLHDFDNHCSNIYKILNSMLEKELKEKHLCNEELFVLNIAVLMHDYSMTSENFDRDKHSKESADLLKKMYSDSLWREVHFKLRDVIPFIIEAHSDIKTEESPVRTMENPKLTDNMKGEFARIRGKYLAACLRLADELDMTRERLGKYSEQLPNLDETDKEQKESLRHWKRLKYIKDVDFSGAIIQITIDDDYIGKLEALQKKEALDEIRKVRNHAQETLQYLNDIEFNTSGVGTRYTDITWEESRVYSVEELENLVVSEKIDINNSGEETEIKRKNQKTETSKKDRVINDAKEHNQKEPINEKCYTWGNVPVISLELEKKITKYIIDNSLIYSGHYRMNRNYCGKDWIDVRMLLQNRTLSRSIADAISENIKKSCDKKNRNHTIIVGVGMNGNIIAARLGYRLHLPFTYVLAGVCGSLPERKVELEEYSNIIIVTGVISTYESINHIIMENAIQDRIEVIYTVLFRKIHGSFTEKYEWLRKKVKAINTIFNASIIQKRDCMLEKNGKCIAENLIAFQQVVDEQGNWEHSLKLVYGNAERVFVNNAIGCNAQCSYCYLPELINEQEDIWKYSHIDALEQLRTMQDFKLGKQGTIISLGCYSECWSDENREETKQLICKLADSENPIQMATKKLIDFEDIEEIDNCLQYKEQLTIYISIPTISESETMEKDTDLVMKRIENFALDSKLKNCNFVLYIKPVLQDITIKDIEKYAEIMRKYKVPCVVGDNLVYSTDGKWTKNMVGEGYLKEDKVDDVDKIMEQLSKVGQVFRHSTDVIKNWRK